MNRPAPNTNTEPVVTEDSAFVTKALPGSLWKTEDGGKNFVPKSQIDEKTSITKSDILSIAYHPRQPGTIYVSSVDNGIFKTENNGEQWMNIPFPPKRIYSFILDKNDPDNRMFASGMVNDWGKIFRTDDGGTTWKDVYTEPGQQTAVTALSQHFRDRNVIFAGTAAGTVVKSVDSGETWKNVGNAINGLVADIAFDAEQNFTTYLLVFGKTLYYSSDGGIKWNDWEDLKRKEVDVLQEKMRKAQISDNKAEVTRLQKQISTLNERNQKNKVPSGIVSIMPDPTRSGVIYAGTSRGFFRSTTFGKYWDEINIIESAKKFSIRSIAVNPKNSKEIVFVAGKAFYKSVDDGATWMTTGLNVDRGASFVTYDPFDSQYLFLGLRNFK
ncbi:MAG: hypothetical protein PHH40_02125 [Candidatus Moranbacteria bacterium]|nr:hypothetical protein [Candidatus Moranbacteria bacterium]MDD3964983.1 hypothetical protein [Candidatus Moranbacteria bacterium]